MLLKVDDLELKTKKISKLKTWTSVDLNNYLYFILFRNFISKVLILK